VEALRACDRRRVRFIVGALFSPSSLAHRHPSIFSYLPPSTTLRAYQRHSLATTGAELGTLYCSIVSFTSRAAHDAPLGADRAQDTAEIVRALIAVRAKLKRSLLLKTNIVYEVRGRGVCGSGGL
jgi:hypothetical protein